MLTQEQLQKIEQIIHKSGIQPLDAIDVFQALSEVVSKSGWGNIQIFMEAKEVSEIVISQRRKPKVDRKTSKV